MDELRASREFYEKHGRTFWLELINEEMKRGERYIGQTTHAHWLTSFVCFGRLGDILCVFPDVFSIDDFNESHISSLISGLLKVFRYYQSTGIYSFNASLIFGPEGQQSFPCHFRIVPRSFLNMRDYASDMAFFQITLAEPVCMKLPEQICREVREYF
jgi:galactose-1-phosphate uridylyltransferase